MLLMHRNVPGTEADGLLQIATSTMTRSSTTAANAMAATNGSHGSSRVKSNGNSGSIGGSDKGGGGTPGRRKKPTLSSRERNVRRIESNERERLRMHGLNEAFQVMPILFIFSLKIYKDSFLK